MKNERANKTFKLEQEKEEKKASKKYKEELNLIQVLKKHDSYEEFKHLIKE